MKMWNLLRIRWQKKESHFEGFKVINGKKIVLKKFKKDLYQVQFGSKPFFKTIGKCLSWADSETRKTVKT